MKTQMQAYINQNLSDHSMSLCNRLLNFFDLDAGILQSPTMIKGMTMKPVIKTTAVKPESRIVFKKSIIYV